MRNVSNFGEIFFKSLGEMKTGFFFQKHGGGISKYIFRGRKECGTFFEILERCCGKIGFNFFLVVGDLPNRCSKRCEGEGKREREEREKR